MPVITQLQHLPKGLSKAEKSAVSRVVAMREAAGVPVEDRELDLVLLYVRGRARLAMLEKKLRTDDFFPAGLLAHTAAIRAEAAACRRLAKDLGLIAKAAA